MKYIFCSFMFDDIEENIRNSKSPNSVSGHKFQLFMLKGLAENGCDITVVNVPRVRRYPDYKKLAIHEKDFKVDGVTYGRSIGFINVYGLNYLTQINNAYKMIDGIIKKNPSEDIVLLVYNTYLSPIIALRRIKSKYPRVKICNLIGDIYGQYGLKSAKSLHGKLIDRVHEKMDMMAKECDAFGLATNNMAFALGVAEKPYVVIEGMYEANELLCSHSNNSTKRKSVFYAGALHKEYGIEHLLRAFALIDDSNMEFYIAGDGDAVGEIKAFSEKDKRLHYLGFITPSEVDKYQSAATALVNPRTSDYEYVKYSFASKNLEYLASGTPYIAHNLPCNPKEYSEYIIYPSNESDESLARTITEVCNLPEEKRVAIGKRNMEFIRKEKNPKVQMRKIDSMLKTL